MLREQAPLISKLHRITDLLITIASFIGAYHIKRNFLPEGYRGLTTEPNYYIVLLLVIIIWYLCLRVYHVYGSYRHLSIAMILWRYAKAVFSGMLFLFTTMYVFKIEHVSRMMLGIFFVLNLGMLFIEKGLVHVLLRKYRSRGFNSRNMLILGGKTAAKELIEAVKSGHWTGFRIIGCLDRYKRHVGKKILGDIKVVGTYDDLKQIILEEVVDELVLADDLTEIPDVHKHVEMADEMGIRVHIMPQWKIRELGINPRIGALKYESFMGIPTLSINSTPEYRGDIILKNIGDYILAAVGILITLPVWLFAAIGIKMHSPGGPVFYRQKRIGQNGREFTLYKFRTMVPNADKQLKELQSANECDGPTFKIKNDPRIIPYVGTFLRKTSLDELPQFINVLKGELSMVGPRPPLPNEVKCYQRWERRRLSMKPGITCFWQVQPNRNDIGFEDWMKMDLSYIDNWSLWLDVKIVFRTAWVILSGSGR